jgi:MFS family permease
MSGSIGPFINVILFTILGDTWDLEILKIVMIIGMVITMISLTSMFFFSDSRSLGEISESLQNNTEINNSIADQERKKRNRLVFVILITSSLIIGIGAGMTIKYFGIFFIEQYTLQPISVQLIMGSLAILTGIAGIISQRLSKNKGRVQMIFAFELAATICLFIIATYPPIWLLIPIFLLRGSLMNGAEPLSRSILMDIVPKKHRGKVNSIQTIAWGLFWNFSAVIGGYLVGDVEPYNFRLNFLVTASVYVFGVFLLIFIFRKVTSEKTEEKKDRQAYIPQIPKANMTRCPECTGEMEFNRQIRKYVCQACGLALNKNEIEDDWEDSRYRESDEDRKDRERQEYKTWYFKKKK